MKKLLLPLLLVGALIVPEWQSDTGQWVTSTQLCKKDTVADMYRRVYYCGPSIVPCPPCSRLLCYPCIKLHKPKK